MHPSLQRGPAGRITVPAIGLLLFAGCGRVQGEDSPGPEDNAMRVEVQSVTTDDASNPLVRLTSLDGNLVLPIWVTTEQARAIAFELADIEMPRPLTHDLMRDIVTGLDARLDRVVVTSIQDNTYYARLELSQNGQKTDVDARPSDAIALALRMDAPIYVMRAVLDEAARKNLGLDSSAALGLGLQGLSSELAEGLGLEHTHGVLVRQVEVSGSARRAGLRVGDVILAVGDKKTTDVRAFSSAVLGSDLPVVLNVLRDGKRLELRLEAAVAPLE